MFNKIVVSEKLNNKKKIVYAGLLGLEPRCF